MPVAQLEIVSGLEVSATSAPRPARTAFLVVHGVGEQNKFETLSGFAAGLKKALDKQRKQQFSISRRLKRLDGFNESYLRLHTSTEEIDVFEYYYQHKLQRRVEPEDVLEWLTTTARRVRMLYRIGAVKRKRPEDCSSTTWQPPIGYLTAAKPLAVIVHLVGLMMPLLRRLFLASVGARAACALLNPLLRDFVGDVTAYTAYNLKEKLNHVRADILDGCAERIRNLLEDPFYDRVVVAGHSLGSVVAYDAISQINSDLTVGAWSGSSSGCALRTPPSADAPRRLRGLITFGSPLDKIALLFWPLNEDQRASMRPFRRRFLRWRRHVPRRRAWQIAKSKWMKEQARLQSSMVQHYHGFSALDIDQGDGVELVPADIPNPLANIVWLNFFHKRDRIAGHLDAYHMVLNIEVRKDAPDGPAFPEAHSYYWYDNEMYKDIIEKLLPQGESAPAPAPTPDCLPEPTLPTKQCEIAA